MKKNSLEQRPSVQTKAKVSRLRNLTPELHDRLRRDLMEACLAVTESQCLSQVFMPIECTLFVLSKAQICSFEPLRPGQKVA